MAMKQQPIGHEVLAIKSFQLDPHDRNLVQLVGDPAPSSKITSATVSFVSLPHLPEPTYEHARRHGTIYLPSVALDATMAFLRLGFSNKWKQIFFQVRDNLLGVKGVYADLHGSPMAQGGLPTCPPRPQGLAKNQILEVTHFALQLQNHPDPQRYAGALQLFGQPVSSAEICSADMSFEEDPHRRQASYDSGRRKGYLSLRSEAAEPILSLVEGARIQKTKSYFCYQEDANGPGHHCAGLVWGD